MPLTAIRLMKHEPLLERAIRHRIQAAISLRCVGRIRKVKISGNGCFKYRLRTFAFSAAKVRFVRILTVHLAMPRTT